MKLINLIFPAKLQLTILQLEGYEIIAYLKWITNNYFRRNITFKRKLVYTQKVKNILIISAFIYLYMTFSFFLNKNFALILLLIFTNPWVVYVLALLLIKPYEIYNKRKIISQTKNKISKLSNLNIIGITGSFGKTSTKEILFQILNSKYETLRTPASFNTVLGIAKVVKYELSDKYEYFICEMGAFRKGEIKTLTKMVKPDYAILTGITTQHFEKFGSLENTIKAKFELIDALDNKNNAIFNLEDQNILSELKERKIKLSGFGNHPKANVKAKNITFDKNGTKFDLYIDNKKYKMITKLFGLANVNNILAAASMALLLGIKPRELVSGIKLLKPVDSRLILQAQGKSLVVNNTYSSNPKAFELLIETARKCAGSKALVTPGIVELGKLSDEIHQNIAKNARDVFDHIVLVGHNKRTEVMSKNIPEKKLTVIKDSRQAYKNEIASLIGKYDWIFLENDVTQNY